MTVDEISANIQVRKQGEVLRHISDPAKAGGRFGARASSEKIDLAQLDSSGDWSA